MTLSIKYRRIDITDEDQKNPVDVTIYVSVHSDAPDVLATRGSDEVGRAAIKCHGTRANVAALMATLTVVDKGELADKPEVLALLSPPLTVP